MTDKIAEHEQWLKDLSDKSSTTPETVELALIAWKKILKITDNKMPVPAACVGDSQIFHSWNLGGHHLELEVFPPPKLSEFFYCNINEKFPREELVGDDWDVHTPIPESFLEKIKLFLD